MIVLESHVSREYRVASPKDQTALGDAIILGIGTTGIGTFGTLAAQIAAFVLINNLYKLKKTAADDGDANIKNDRDDYRDDFWLPAVDLLAEEVENIAKGNKSVVELSGFKSTSTERVSKVTPVQSVLEAESGASRSNSIELSTKTKIDAHAFLAVAIETGTGTLLQNGNQLILTFTDEEGKVIGKAYLAVSTTKDITMTGLTRKEDLDVQTVSFNAAGCSPLSNKANVLVP